MLAPRLQLPFSCLGFFSSVRHVGVGSKRIALGEASGGSKSNAFTSRYCISVLHPVVLAIF